MRELFQVELVWRSVAIALAAIAWTGSAAPTLAVASGELAGPARVLDGDTLDVSGSRVRLEGIDAPEAGQSCAAVPSGSWDCGAAATRALEQLIAARPVSCTLLGQDKYGRNLGLCRAGDRDLNEEMVASGYAWAFVRYSDRYVAAETKARERGLGIWQATTEPAWSFREKRWVKAGTDAPEGCAIKGNVSRKGLYYHVPWNPWYDRVKVDVAKGERWFCSEREALAAGWQPASFN